jgi:capsular polysaccharide biosynthesis protein
MNIIPFSKYTPVNILKNTDDSGREINYINLQNIQIIGRNNLYPNCLLWNSKKQELVSPYDEKVMSLNKESFYDGTYDISTHNMKELEVYSTPVYFFIYNFDNYFHFIYDTLPYLCSYFKLKKTIPNLKLLVSYPNTTRNTFYKFNEDIFDIFNIRDDIIIHNELYQYSAMYVANSLTHGGMSNDPPHKEIYELFNNLNIPLSIKSLPKKIYISRRTWIHNDKTNLGTDYTQRRKMMNEDILVEKLIDNGFEEVFCENLSMIEKIQLFKQADEIVGAIGGGMCNLLFSLSSAKVICIVSPYFLDINKRFHYSMDHTNIQYIYDTEVYKTHGQYPLYVRVKITDNNEYYNRIGEIIDYHLNNKDSYLVQLSNNDVAGFNNAIEFQKVYFNKDQFELLDQGLNSPYTVNIESVLNALK